jgi:hypothetical protein
MNLERSCGALVKALWRYSSARKIAICRTFQRINCLVQEYLLFFCSNTATCNLSSTLYPQKCLVYNSSYKQSIVYISNKINELYPN